MEGAETKYIHLIKDHNLNAPHEIVPFLINIFHPKSMVDVGCGLGTFLNVFIENGVDDVTGIDGSWIDKSKLFVPERYIIEENLEQPFTINRKFDLVLCLEVGEHLATQSADILIQNLISLGDIIIFSAAIVNQGGQNHINEQPFGYWIEKFNKHDYLFYDVFRTIFWNNSNIDWWYKQNMFLVAKVNVKIFDYLPDVKPITEVNEYVHPELLAMHTENIKMCKQSLKKYKEGEFSPYVYLNLLRKSVYKKFLR